MADNKKIQDGRDGSQVDTNDSNELSYLQQKHGATRDQIKAAIEAVGNDRSKIEDFLKSAK